VVVLDEQRLAVRPHLAGGRPVPQHLGGNAATGELGDVAGLAGHLVGVVVDLGFLVRAGRGRTRRWRGCGRLWACPGPLVSLAGGVAAAGGLWALKVWQSAQTMLAPSLAMCTSKFARLFQRGVEVAVLDRIATATAEVAGAAVVPPRFAHMLGDLGQVRRLDEFLAGRAFLGSISRGPRRAGGRHRWRSSCRCRCCRGRPGSPHCPGW
jgi:hypothetical protein